MKFLKFKNSIYALDQIKQMLYCPQEHLIRFHVNDYCLSLPDPWGSVWQNLNEFLEFDQEEFLDLEFESEFSIQEYNLNNHIDNQFKLK